MRKCSSDVNFKKSKNSQHLLFFESKFNCMEMKGRYLKTNFSNTTSKKKNYAAHDSCEKKDEIIYINIF